MMFNFQKLLSARYAPEAGGQTTPLPPEDAANKAPAPGRVHILADSTADLPDGVAAQVRVIPLSVRFGEEEFLDGLYRKLSDCFGPEECRILMESVGAYYACGRSVTAAAQKLFIHKNTLQYRVHQVLETLELTGLPGFQQEYLVRLLNAHLYRKSRPEGLEK